MNLREEIKKALDDFEAAHDGLDIAEDDLTPLVATVTAACNRCSAENGSQTPDVVLGKFLVDCLRAFKDLADSQHEDATGGMAGSMVGWLTAFDEAVKKRELLNNAGQTFKLTPDQRIEATMWKQSVLASAPSPEGAIGGRFTYSFTETSIGTICSIHDSVTGAKKDLSEYGSW